MFGKHFMLNEDTIHIVEEIGRHMPGGFLIYSTCTFNRMEDEDNVAVICEELGGICLEMRHFWPGEDRGEGFFASLIRKEDRL